MKGKIAPGKKPGQRPRERPLIVIDKEGEFQNTKRREGGEDAVRLAAEKGQRMVRMAEQASRGAVGNRVPEFTCTRKKEK